MTRFAPVVATWLVYALWLVVALFMLLCAAYGAVFTLEEFIKLFMVR